MTARLVKDEPINIYPHDANATSVNLTMICRIIQNRVIERDAKLHRVSVTLEWRDEK